MATLFVHENPNGESRRKKRLRVVTSCDECRERKIKCVQVQPDAANRSCQSCMEAGISCEYKDKERYYAEYQSGTIRRPKSSSRTTQAPSVFFCGTSSPSAGSSNGSSVSSSSSSPSPGSFNPTLSSERLHPLYEPQSSPSYPHSALIPSLLYIFFQSFGASYPFLSYDDAMQKYLRSRFNPVLANVIAAMATPHACNLPELAGYDLTAVSQSYMATGKNLLTHYLRSNVSSSTLHAVLLVAWYEASCVPFYGTEFKYYSELALQTATRFGLNDENTMLQIANGNLVQLGRLQVTWASICQLFSLPTTTVRRTDPRSAVM